MVIENASGGLGADVITGNNARNLLNGGGGNDLLKGGRGNDTLSGGDGRDTLTGSEGGDKITGGKGADILAGGRGDDIFVYNSRDEGGDTISDFSSTGNGNNDRFHFKASAFGNLPLGELAESRFQSSNADVAQSNNVRFFYEQDTQTLRFDPDGSGGQAAIVIAVLQAGATMTSADIFII